MNVFQLLTVLLGIAGMAGGAAGYFAKSRGDTIISLQGKEIEYWKDKATQLEKDFAAVQAERNSVKQLNVSLMDEARGNPQLAKLSKEVKILSDTQQDLSRYIRNLNGKK